jgi:hypothetical protein
MGFRTFVGEKYASLINLREDILKTVFLENLKNVKLLTPIYYP